MPNKADLPPPLPTNGVKFPEFLQSHPAVPLFQRMKITDFAKVCHFFGYMMMPEAKLIQMVKSAAAMKKVKPTDKEILSAVCGMSTAKINNKEKRKWEPGQQHKKKLRGALKSGTRARKSK